MSSHDRISEKILKDEWISEPLIEHLPLPVFVMNRGGDYRYFNKAFISFFNIPLEAVSSITIDDFLEKDQKANALANNELLTLSGQDVQYGSIVKDYLGKFSDVVIHKTLFFSKSGEPLFIGTITDVTELKTLQRYQQTMFTYSEMLLRINQSITKSGSIEELLDVIMMELKTVFGHQSCGCILVSDGDYFRMATQFGYTQEAMENFCILIKESYYWRYAKHDLNKVYRINQIDLITEEDYTKVASTLEGIEMLSSLTAPLWVDDKLFGLINFDSPIRDGFSQEQADFMEYVSKQLAIAIKNMMLYQRTVQLSRNDTLTGLYNRHYFESQVNEMLSSCVQLGKAFHLVAIDADYLKRINDEMGHLAGDQVLIDIARSIGDASGPEALVARFGGDEYLVAVSEMDFDMLSERLIKARAELEKIQYGNYPCSFSFGIATYSCESSTYIAMLKAADDAMYHEKRLRIGERRKHDEPI